MPISVMPAPEQRVHQRVATRTVTLRATLLLGCAANVTLAAWAGNPVPYLDSDFALGRLLRAMAAIKAGVVFAAISLLWWRFKRPVQAHLAVVCLIATWLAAGASMMIWQLTAIPLAALTFHAGGLAFLVAAWWDHRTSTPARAAWSFFKGRR